MSRNVSITLQNTDTARPIIEAITTDNPDAVINDYPGIVKIDCAGRLVVNRETVERLIGRAWDPQELHLSLVSMAGNVDEDDDYFALAWTQ